MRLFIFYLFLGLLQVCKIELSHMGKSNKKPDLVCEKNVEIYLLYVPNLEKFDDPSPGIPTYLSLFFFAFFLSSLSFSSFPISSTSSFVLCRTVN